MTRDEFWALIDSARSGDDPCQHAKAIQTALSQQPAAEIVDFERHMSDRLAASYTWDLWGAAYLINGGCSDDGFDYFRGWLIIRGQSVFAKAVDDPDSLANLPELEEGVECEEVLYIARSAYENVAGGEIPSVSINPPELGEDWDFDDDTEMKKRYPKLFAKFGED